LSTPVLMLQANAILQTKHELAFHTLDCSVFLVSSLLAARHMLNLESIELWICNTDINKEDPTHFLHQLVRYRTQYDVPILVLSANPEPYLFICHHLELPFLRLPGQFDDLIDTMRALIARPYDFHSGD